MTDAALSVGNGDAAGPLLEVQHLEVHFPIRAGLFVERSVARVHAVDDVSFELAEG